MKSNSQRNDKDKIDKTTKIISQCKDMNSVAGAPLTTNHFPLDNRRNCRSLRVTPGKMCRTPNLLPLAQIVMKTWNEDDKKEWGVKV